MSEQGASALAPGSRSRPLHQARARIPGVTPILLALLGVGTRLFHLTANGLRTDESWTAWYTAFSIQRMLQLHLSEGVGATPPLYFALVHPLLFLGRTEELLRLPSVVAGSVIVLATFWLAGFLFDRRVALLSAAMVALSPLLVEYSQVARAYALHAALGLLSVYAFSRLLLGSQRIWWWIIYVVTTLAAAYTFYLALLLVLAQNGAAALWWLRGRRAHRWFGHWLASQAVVGLGLLPLLSRLITITATSSEVAGQGWLGRPGPATVMRSVILFTTGDPSSGPAGVTLLRLASVVTVALIVILGLFSLRRNWHVSMTAREQDGLALLALLFAGPWSVALLASQVRPVYHEKYLLFLVPLALIALAWALLQIRRPAIAVVLTLVLLSLSGTALTHIYTEPTGEQWREATRYVMSHTAGEPVLIVPGYYSRPLIYYADGNFPDDMLALVRSPAVAQIGSEYLDLDPADPATWPAAVRAAERVWLVTGYASEPETARWFSPDFQVVQDEEWAGARVRLLERVQ
ncbi:MAG: hypothetical protein D6791_11245 [Chloroflexi bacterium]|nr:MAG: hypothetical protein D6791_11245 [Chloroflexota bacterium]